MASTGSNVCSRCSGLPCPSSCERFVQCLILQLICGCSSYEGVIMDCQRRSHTVAFATWRNKHVRGMFVLQRVSHAAQPPRATTASPALLQCHLMAPVWPTMPAVAIGLVHAATNQCTGRRGACWRRSARAKAPSCAFSTMAPVGWLLRWLARRSGPPLLPRFPITSPSSSVATPPPGKQRLAAAHRS